MSRRPVRWRRIVLAVSVLTLASPLPARDSMMPANLSGRWVLSRDQAGYFARIPPALTAKGKAIYRQRRAAIAAGSSADPLRACISPGIPRAMYLPLPIEIVQDARQIVMLYPISQRVRRIAIDGRPRNDRLMRDFGPLYNGYAIGRWDRGAWVIETVGLDPTTWIDASGVPKSANARIIEHARRSGGTLIVDTTIIDPEMLVRPWTTRKVYRPAKAEAVPDDSCTAERARNDRWFG